MRVVLLAVLLVGCAYESNEWPSGAKAKPAVVGVAPGLLPLWHATVRRSLEQWDASINYDHRCPMPIGIVDFLDGADGCEVRLVAPAQWSRDPKIIGAEQNCYIEILGDVPQGREPVLAHELGHAIGLPDNDEPSSIMFGATQVDAPNAWDVARARAALGCD